MKGSREVLRRGGKEWPASRKLKCCSADKPCAGLCGKALANSAAALPPTVPCPLEGRGSAPVHCTWPGWRPCPRTSDLPSSSSEATRRTCSPFTASDAQCGGCRPKLRGWDGVRTHPLQWEKRLQALLYHQHLCRRWRFQDGRTPSDTFRTLKSHGKASGRFLSLSKKLLFVLMTKVSVIDSVFDLYTN